MDDSGHYVLLSLSLSLSLLFVRFHFLALVLFLLLFLTILFWRSVLPAVRGAMMIAECAHVHPAPYCIISICCRASPKLFGAVAISFIFSAWPPGAFLRQHISTSCIPDMAWS